jgi:hypothetical protein
MRTKRLLRASLFTAICTLAVFAGFRAATADTPRTCITDNCSSLTQFAADGQTLLFAPDCGDCRGVPGLHLCNTSHSTDVFCICYQTTQNQCATIIPVQIQRCHGGCVDDFNVSCTCSWNRCSPSPTDCPQPGGQ